MFASLAVGLDGGRTARKASVGSLFFCIQNQSDENPLQYISYLMTTLKSTMSLFCAAQEHILFCCI